MKQKQMIDGTSLRERDYSLLIKGDLILKHQPSDEISNISIYWDGEEEDAIILEGDVTLSTNPSCNVYVTGDLIVEGQ